VKQVTGKKCRGLERLRALNRRPVIKISVQPLPEDAIAVVFRHRFAVRAGKNWRLNRPSFHRPRCDANGVDASVP
jgi:type II secretory pathway predicted ATPase ExeA